MFGGGQILCTLTGATTKRQIVPHTGDGKRKEIEEN